MHFFIKSVIEATVGKLILETFDSSEKAAIYVDAYNKAAMRIPSEPLASVTTKNVLMCVELRAFENSSLAEEFTELSRLQLKVVCRLLDKYGDKLLAIIFVRSIWTKSSLRDAKDLVDFLMINKETFL